MRRSRLQVIVPQSKTAWRFASSPSELNCSASRRQARSGITELWTSSSYTMCYSLRILSSSQQKIWADQCSLLANAHRGCGRSNRSTFRQCVLRCKYNLITFQHLIVLIHTEGESLNFSAISNAWLSWELADLIPASKQKGSPNIFGMRVFHFPLWIYFGLRVCVDIVTELW